MAASLQLPASSYAAIRAGADRHPDATALVHLSDGTVHGREERWSYAELCADVTRTANLLRRLGVTRGDAVSLLLANLAEAQIALWGAAAAGVANPINAVMRLEHVADIMRSAETKVLVTEGPGNAPLWEKAVRLRELVPSLRAIVAVGAGAAAGDAVLDFRAAIAAERAERLDSRRRIDPQELAAYFHTGGTTGLPKLAKQTHANQVTDAWGVATVGRFAERSAMGMGLPLFHAAGVIICSLAPLVAGKAIVMLGPNGFRDRAVIEGLWDVVERHGVDMLMAVPTVVARLVEVPAPSAVTDRVTLTICGASPVSVGLAERWERRMGRPLIVGYGLTEGACVSALTPADGPVHLGSVGPALPGHEIRVVRFEEDADPAASPDCAPGEPGLVLVRGPNIFPGYKRPELDEGVLLRRGWLNTGDLGHLDEDGYLYLTGRAKDLIKRGGHGIDPALIEQALAEHPAVAIAAAVGRPDPEVGELPVAYVQLRPEAGDVDPEELRTWCRPRIGDPAAVPVELYVIDALPVTQVGKISKVELRRDAAHRVINQVA